RAVSLALARRTVSSVEPAGAEKDFCRECDTAGSGAVHRTASSVSGPAAGGGHRYFSAGHLLERNFANPPDGGDRGIVLHRDCAVSQWWAGGVSPRIPVGG